MKHLLIIIFLFFLSAWLPNVIARVKEVPSVEVFHNEKKIIIKGTFNSRLGTVGFGIKDADREFAPLLYIGWKELTNREKDVQIPQIVKIEKLGNIFLLSLSSGELVSLDIANELAVTYKPE